MIPRVLAFLFVAAVASIVVQSQPPSPSRGKLQRRQPQQQTTNTQQQPAPDPRGTDPSPLVVKVQPTPKTNEETAKEKAKEQEEASAKRWTFGLTILTAIMALLQLGILTAQVIIAARQNKIMNTQSEIMAEQKRLVSEQADYMRDGLIETKKAANAAGEGAVAAKQSAEVAADTLKLTQRPFALGTSEVVGKQSADGRMANWELQLVFHNGGQRPAIECRTVSRHCLIEAQGAKLAGVDIDSFNMLEGVEKSPPAVLGIDRSAHGEIVPIDQGLLGRIEEYSARLFLCAMIEYRDVIPGTPTYESAICVEVVMKPGADRWRDEVPFVLAARGVKYNYMK